MPRLTRSTPRLCKVRNRAVVYLAGETHSLGRYGSPESKRRYRQLLSEWEAANRPTQPLPAPADITVGELCLAYRDHAVAYYRSVDGVASGEIHPIKVAIKALRTVYGMTPAAEFGPRAFKALRNEWIDRGLSRGTINRYADRIKRIFKWAVSEQMLPPSVSQALATVGGLRAGRSDARETEAVAPVSDTTVEVTLPHLSPVVADMVRLQRLTGCRPGELCNLRPADVDTTEEIWLYRPARHKTAYRGKQRVVALGPKAQAILRPYLLRPADAPCFSPKDSERKRRQARHEARKTPLEQGNAPGTNLKKKPARKAGERYTPSSYARAIGRACELAFGMPKELRSLPKEIPGVLPELQESERLRLQQLATQWRSENCWSPNQLRHSFATAVRRSHGLEGAQVALGHSSADVTQIYAERNLTLAVNVAKAVG